MASISLSRETAANNDRLLRKGAVAEDDGRQRCHGGGPVFRPLVIDRPLRLWSRLSEASPVDAKFAHFGAQGVRIDLEFCGGAIAAFDLAVSRRKGGLNVSSHGDMKRFQGSRRRRRREARRRRGGGRHGLRVDA